MSRAMKDSGITWIGEIPGHWTIVPFRSYVQERGEKNKGEKTRELLALSFALGVTLYRDKLFNMDRVKENFEDYQLVYKDDLVLSPNDIIKGSVYVSQYYGCISPMYHVFSSRDTNTYYLPYLSFLLRTQEAGRKFFFIARGLIGDILENGKYVTRRMTVSRQDLLSFPVLLPPFVEQKKIVCFLDKKCGDIDEMVSLQEKIIEELKAYKQSVITEAVTKGLNPNVPMRDSGIEWIGQIPKGWSIDKIVRSFDLIGSGTTPKSTDETNFEGDICWIQSGDINGSYLTSCNNRISNDTLERFSALKVYNAPFIIIAMYGASVGNASISQINGCVNQACCVLKGNRLNLNYAFAAIRACKDYLIRKAVGGGQPNISQDTIKSTWIPVPPKNEQQAIADYLDTKCAEIDALISLKQSKIESLKEYKKSIIYEYVTGKKEVIE